MIKYRLLLLLSPFLFLYSIDLCAQSGGIQGRVSDTEGEGLGFATIYIRNIETGTTTNNVGDYQVKLKPGKYDIVFQYLGYETLVKFITVDQQMQHMDVELENVTFQLREFVVDSDKEDPAYTIMRKAIAKSSFHRQQLDSYSARVYIKGSGRLLDAPFFLRKRIAKEGLDSNMAFTSESVIDVEYERPNTYRQNVISVRTSGDDSDASPNGYIFGSFYEAKINDAISPLSPRAMLHYHFKYLGSFTDRGYMINMIKVIPKSKGDNLFSGDIFITDDLYSIYSLDLQTSTYGIGFNIKVIYGPIEDKVWMPINHQFDVEGSIMGFDFEGIYLAVVSDYKIKINPDLDYTFEVVDEKIESEKAEVLELKPQQKSNPLEGLNTEEELTRKQLKNIIKEYEKQEMAEMNSENITTITNFTVDSLASKKDSAYWNAIRPVPLNNYEVVGYHRLDSIAEVEKEEALKDSTKNDKNFQWSDPIMGGGYSLDSNKKHHFRIYSMLEQVNFNSVDGLYIGYKVRYRYKIDDDRRLKFTPRVRYAFSRKAWTGDIRTDYDFGKHLRDGNLFLSAGRFTSQFNSDDPISELNNAFTSLVLSKNYIKIYEKNYVTIGFEKRISDKVSLDIRSEFSERRSLQNNTDFTFFNWEDREYGSNNPTSIELDNTAFPVHQSWVSTLALSYRPWLKFTKENGKKREKTDSSPEFSFLYSKGIASDFSVVDFDRIELGVKHRIRIGAGSALSMNIKYGNTLNNSQMTFIDYKHFMGNRSPFETNDPVASYRLLPYYDYSTKEQYLVGHLYYKFRKFLLTQITLVRFAGLTENVFVNYLGTNYSDNYVELGYGIDNIFRFFRIEGILSFQNGKLVDSGLRIGITTILDFD